MSDLTKPVGRATRWTASAKKNAAHISTADRAHAQRVWREDAPTGYERLLDAATPRANETR